VLEGDLDELIEALVAAEGSPSASSGVTLMTPRQRFRTSSDAATTALEAAGVPGARGDAEWLMAGLLDLAAPASDGPGAPRPAGSRSATAEAVRRRARREQTLQRILGWENFAAARTTDASRAAAGDRGARRWRSSPAAVGRSPAAGDRSGHGVGVHRLRARADRATRRARIDLCPAAAAVARQNGRPRPRVQISVVVADLLHGIGGPGGDLVVKQSAVPPTALVPELLPEVRSHEPTLALDGGVDGLALIRRIAAQARRVLRPSGVLVVETRWCQATAAATLWRPRNFVQVEVRADLAGVSGSSRGEPDAARLEIDGG